MNTSDYYWNLFLQTGSPADYLLFRNAARMEERDVLEDTGPGPAPDGLQ